MERNLPLQGIRVVDLTLWAQGPIASAMLGDLGAEVIKVEKPGVGDFLRGVESLYGARVVLPDGRPMLWELSNRNKKGIAVNFYHPVGQEVFHRLIRKSDVLLTNLHPATLRKMGADKGSVLKQNPDILYALASAYGSRGPQAEDNGVDLAGLGRSGYMFLSATPEGVPTATPGGISDILAGTMLAFGVVAALLAKERGVVVPAVCASQLSSMLWLTNFAISMHANTGQDFIPHDRTDTVNPLNNYYKCADGKWYASALAVSDMFWHQFCEALNLPEIERDPRFATMDQRTQNRRQLIAILEQTFGSKPRDHWDRLFRERDFWGSVVNEASDVLEDPQVRANGYVVTLDNGVKTAALPFELDGVELPRRGAPEHGQHTDEILQDVCGYSWDDIVAMKEEEIVW